MKVTIKPKNGKPIVKRFSDPKKAIAWINSTTAEVAAQQKRAADLLESCDCDRSSLHDCVCPQCRARYIANR